MATDELIETVIHLAFYAGWPNGMTVIITFKTTAEQISHRPHRTRLDHTHSFEGEAPMAAWTSDELDTIGNAEELELASQQSDGTLRDPVTMWVVRIGDELYVRSMHGRASAWYRGTQTRHQGRIAADGLQRDVTFADADRTLDEEIDEVYRTKYRRYGANIIGGVVNSDSRAATIKLVPRS